MTTRVWNLMYALGNTERIIGDDGNPQSRQAALEGAAAIDKNGWRVWVEHQTSAKRIFESAREIEHRSKSACLKKEDSMPTQMHPTPQGYFEAKAYDALVARGLVLPRCPTPLESKLMAQLLLVSGAAERVLSDVDDDGVAEAADVAVHGMRKALQGQRLPEFMPKNT